ncbi:hypothetical protein [Streptomyces sp. NBC_00083]|uniref:hypothetical protein n=1 Tax=Streptomyces sp. NBC_00083 TaxID=2975647 RepID=UPI00224EDFBD|nr:hypothetical protein [Streptomyces sp. NBC_00083]MCX5387415.1 hypothetical protein [Streptomyces sp. NBC_00083]
MTVLASAAVFLAVLPAAQAAHAPQAGGVDVAVSYEAPHLNDDGSHVTWHWKLTNTGTKTARKITLTHTLNPPLNHVEASAPCQNTGTSIRCAYDSIPAGATREGTVEADVPADLSGTLHINGRVTSQSGT